MNDKKITKRPNKRVISILKQGGKRFSLKSVDEDKADIRAAEKARKNGVFISWEEAKAELNLLD
ncbi:MAG: hypothetical protein ACR2L1_03000 [Pyrinomonadaceae bacterium]